MGKVPRTLRGLRIVAVAGLLALAFLPSTLPGLRSPAPVLAASGGCSPASSTCYLFDLSMSGTGFGTYRTMDEGGTYTGRIVCNYGNESQTGTCGWGYEASTAGAFVDIFYRVSPDFGSQACDADRCFGPDDLDAHMLISGNYLEAQWRFELINKFQIDVLIVGAGSGEVTSQPVGIDCPGDCDDLFAANIPVTLTAAPSSNSVFVRWEGDACTGTKPSCVLTTDYLRTVTARFARKTTPAPPTKEPTEELTEEPTEEPTDEPTDEPTPEITATAEPTATEGATTEPTASLTAAPSPTAATAPTSSPGPGNLPIVIGLVVVLVMVIGGAAFFLRRDRTAVG